MTKTWTVALARVGSTLFILLASVYLDSTVTAQSTPGGRKLFANSIVPFTTPQLGLSAAAAPSEAEKNTNKLELHFLLNSPEAAQLKERVAKGEVVSPEEMNTRYSIPQKDYDSLHEWLTKNGFTITQETSDRSGIYATATVGQIEKVLKVKTQRVTRDGITYYAARTPPSMPTQVSVNVIGIDGLQPFLQANKHMIRVPAVRNSDLGHGMAVAAASATAPDIMKKPPYLVTEIVKAYDADKLQVTGQGETIAILIDTLPSDKDLEAFWKRNSVPVTLDQVEEIKVSGSLPDRQGEETLDVEWATGVAPGAVIRVYAAGSLQFVDLDKALDRIMGDLQSHPGIHQLSISLGLGETFMSQAELAAEDTRFARFAALGVNVFVSTGDAGSNPDETGHSSTGPLQAEYQSSDPFVIAVGGTTLSLDISTGGAKDEAGWPGSGGGISKEFERPVWQKQITGPGVPLDLKRLVPDVSSAADPETGALIVFDSKEQQIGGTSWSAPTWAGFCALINEYRAKHGKNRKLGFLNPAIYPLQGTDAFRDILTGSNGHYTADKGFDLVTGIGVPDVAVIAQKLQ